MTMWPAPAARTSVASGSSSAIRSACWNGVSRSSSPDSTSTCAMAQAGERGETVVSAQCGQEIRQHRRPDVTFSIATMKSTSSEATDVVAERQEPHSLPGQAAARGPHPAHQAGCHAAKPPTVLVIGLYLDSNGLGRPRLPTSPADVPINATPRDPVGEQLWPLFGQRHDRHAAHRVADQHQRAVRRHGPDDHVQVAAQLVDRAGLAARLAGAAVACAGRRAPCRRAGSCSSARSRRWKCQQRRSSAKPCTSTTVSVGFAAVGRVDLLDRQRHAVVARPTVRRAARPRSRPNGSSTVTGRRPRWPACAAFWMMPATVSPAATAVATPPMMPMSASGSPSHEQSRGSGGSRAGGTCR